MDASGTAEDPEAPAWHAAAWQAWFVADLVRRRMVAGLSQGDLGMLMGYDRTYVNKVERRAVEPTSGFARRADETLGALGELLDRWRAFDRARRAQRESPGLPPPASPAEMVTDLVVERDEAWVAFGEGRYRLRVQEQIRNVGDAPVTRFYVRIWLGGRQVGSRLHARPGSAPTLEELGLRAWCADEPMTLEMPPGRGRTRELCLLFRNARGQFPLYPGEGATVEYAYGVGTERWDWWFERSVRLPTRWLGVHLAFPEGLGPSVWGVEVPPGADDRPFTASIRRESEAGEARFLWSTARPPLQARYRLEWAFRAEAVRS